MGDTRARDYAQRLIEEFGTFADVLHSKPAAHFRLFGDVEAWRILQSARQAIRYFYAADLHRRPILDSWQQLLAYLKVELAALPIEHFRVIYLDGRNNLIRDETVSKGTIDQAQVHVREIIVRALDLHASGMILVHNHPSGDPKPSKQDIQLTRQIVDAARNLQINVHDHLVIARGGHTSMRSDGMI